MSSIPSFAMPHARAAVIAPPRPRTSPLERMSRLVTAPAFLALGLGAIAVSALAEMIERHVEPEGPEATGPLLAS